MCVFLVGVQSEKLSSPVGSLGEGLNRELSSSELTTLSTRTTTADTDASTASTGVASQFRSPLLRQMIGNKLVATGSPRPTSATDDVTTSASGKTRLSSVKITTWYDKL